MSFDYVLPEIGNERCKQDVEWGGAEHDDQHSQSDWLDFITKQVIRATHERSHAALYRERLVKIAALAVAAIESHDRRAG